MLTSAVFSRSRPAGGAAAALAALVLLATPGGAQEEPAADSSAVDTPAVDTAAAGAPPSGQVRPVEGLVVTAHRMPLPRQVLTSSVTVLDREEVERSGARHVADLLRSVRGLHVVQTGSWGGTSSLFVRGGESNYVQVLVDGVPVNQPGGDFDFSALSTANVERVEVVRGPASVLYGSSAVSGVVQIFTRDGEGPTRISAGVRGGTHGTLDWEASAGGEAGPLSWSAALGRFRTDGLRDFNNEFRNTTASLRLRLTDAPGTDVSLSVRHSDHEAHTPTDGAGRAVDENQFGFGQRTVVALDAGRELGERLEARVQLRWHRLDAGFDDERDGPADTTGVFAFQQESEVTRRSVDARLNYRLPGPTVLTAGAQLEEEDEESSNLSRSGFGTSRGSLSADRDNAGYYLQGVTRLADRVSLSAGVRLDDNQAFGTYDTWRLGAAWDVGPSTRIRGSWGTAFKEPTFTENFSTGFVTGNPDLDPETSESWEAGVERSLAGGAVTVEAAWFHQEFRDLIQFTATPPSEGEPNFFNVAAAEASGLEAGASLRTASPVRADVEWTWVDSRVEDAGFASGPDAAFVEGRPLLRRPAHRVTATLAWAPRDAGSIRVEGSWVDEREDRDFTVMPADRVVLDDYVRLDLSARWPVLERRDGRPSLVPTVRVDNVLDADYQEVFNFPARGRTVFVGAEAALGL